MKLILHTNFPENALGVADAFINNHPNNIGVSECVIYGEWGDNNGFYAYKTKAGTIIVKDFNYIKS
jgi:hypothetical protein